MLVLLLVMHLVMDPGCVGYGLGGSGGFGDRCGSICSGLVCGVDGDGWGLLASRSPLRLLQPGEPGGELAGSLVLKLLGPRDLAILLAALARFLGEGLRFLGAACLRRALLRLFF